QAVSGRLLSLRSSGLRGRLLASLRDVVLAHLRIERGTAQAQDRGRGLLVPARGLERLEDRGALDLLQRARRHLRRRDGAAATLARRVLERLGQVGQRDL